MQSRIRYLLLVCFAVLGTACARAVNYPLPAEPRYAGVAQPAPDTDDAIHVVTFNVRYADRISDAITLLQEDPALERADILFLQEMDSNGARRIAESLNLHWIYYPAVIHPHHDRDFGNAILSRWPIERDRKIVLPHRAAIVGSQRIAVTGLVTVRGVEIALYNIHLGLPIITGRADRHEQAQTVVADALTHADRAIVAGDLNWRRTGEVFERAGFAWPTHDLGNTTRFFSVDHIFTRGFRAGAVPPAGIVVDNRGVSDHLPVWAVVIPDTVQAPPPALRRNARRDDSLGISNAAWIEPTLLRGGRPSDGGLLALKERGFRTVINLTNDDDERREAERLGLDYFEIPLTAHLWSGPPTEDELTRFFNLVLDADRRPLFIHCHRGKDRTGMMAALYRIEAHGWPAVDAVREMQALGYWNWYDDPIDYVRSYVRRGRWDTVNVGLQSQRRN